MTTVTMPTRALGGLRVGALGLGCMGMTEFYGATEDAESIATVHRALDRGVTMFDTADVYARGRNEELLGRALTGSRRERAVVATKVGVVREDDRVGTGVRGDAAFVRQAAENSLRRLGGGHIDLLYQTRVDTTVPIEETVGALSDLVTEGKVRYIGLSEAGAGTVRRAHASHPLAAVQTEWSLWSRDVEDEVVGVCRELGIGIVAAAPLGRGFLTGCYRDVDWFDASDFRRIAQPRFTPENLPANLPLIERLERFAAARGVTPGQLALGWLLNRGDDVVPIPGTRRRAHLDENIDAVDLVLGPADWQTVAAAVPADEVHGQRYVESSMRMLNL